MVYARKKSLCPGLEMALELNGNWIKKRNNFLLISIWKTLKFCIIDYFIRRYL